MRKRTILALGAGAFVGYEIYKHRKQIQQAVKCALLAHEMKKLNKVSMKPGNVKTDAETVERLSKMPTVNLSDLLGDLAELIDHKGLHPEVGDTGREIYPGDNRHPQTGKTTTDNKTNRTPVGSGFYYAANTDPDVIPV